MGRLARQFLSTATLVCRLPLPSPREFDLGRTDLFLPIVGVFAAAAAWAGSAIGRFLVPAPAAAALGALGLQYLAFNLFHLDGLLDSADALFPVADRDRRLQILKDSRIGSYAFATGLFVLAAKAVALGYSIERSGGRPLIQAAVFAYPVVGRAAAGMIPIISRPARKEGLGSLMRGFSPAAWAIGCLVSLAPCAAAVAIWGGAWPCAAFAAVALACLAGTAFGLSAVYRSKVGGFTGDTLGAAVELGETAFLLAASAILGRL